MAKVKTQMRGEIEEIPAVVDRLLTDPQNQIKNSASAIRKIDPSVFCTIARGSSDHAAQYFKYAAEILTGIPVASLGPSVASIYQGQFKLDRAVCLAISQSGASPDIIAAIDATKATGALSIAVTNDTDSKLAKTSDLILDICARQEKSVAATKTFFASVVVGLQILAELTGDQELQNALGRLPRQIEDSLALGWPELEHIKRTDQLYILGRGPALGIASEMALKFKETCQIQAEAYSSAEFLHGPVSVMAENNLLLGLVARDQAESSVVSVLDDLAGRKMRVYATSDKVKKARKLSFAASGHPLTDPLLLIVTFYAFVEELSRNLALDPDRPRALNKVTETI